MVSVVAADVRKSWLAQSSRRTRASASLKVGNGFGYQLAARGGGVVGPYRSWAHSVIKENSPSRAGVVRAIAGSDHWVGSQPRGDGELRQTSLRSTSGERTIAGCRAGRHQGPCRGTPRTQFAVNVADQHVADRHEPAGVVPQRGAGDDLDHPRALSIPACHLQAAPARLGIGQTCRQAGLPLSDHAGAANGAGPAPGRRIEQACIEAQARDHAHAPADRVVKRHQGSRLKATHSFTASFRPRTLWGFQTASGTVSWSDDMGADGYKGATLHAQFGDNAGLDALVTFAGLTAGGAHFASATGTIGGLSYLFVTRTA